MTTKQREVYNIVKTQKYVRKAHMSGDDVVVVFNAPSNTNYALRVIIKKSGMSIFDYPAQAGGYMTSKRVSYANMVLEGNT